ncbi:hypothetical protein [Haloarcula nitratireducens]|uniref:Small CPxCG-related zinc finger protein n=1 Tax=Haloarcula nitratireducens TaxID=2487749 RepID=A0AAW4PDQ5_9EURY|nr:hypothetical protein [Halomicroarcula nitratireducens]MBX0296102.1 hypothetical protein [Halomicroarcula nitratireducens]
MSVLDTVKQKVGMADEKPEYRCEDCGNEFESDSDPGSYWFQCPECGSEDLTEIDAE